MYLNYVVLGRKPNVNRHFVKVNPTLVNRREPKCWFVKSNPTLARKREPDRRYAIASPTRLKNGNSTVALPTLILRWFNIVKLTPTISTFYRRWFDVTLQTNSIFWNNSHHSVKYQLNPCQTIITRCIPNDLHLLQTDMVTQYTYMMF